MRRSPVCSILALLVSLALPGALGAQPAADAPAPPLAAPPAALPPAAALPPQILDDLAGLEAELGQLEAAAGPSSPGALAELPPTTRDELAAGAFEEMRTTGRAPIVALPGGQLFPFGQTVPELVCLPDRACDVELEAGEVVDGLALGDAARWEAAQFFEGEAPHLAPHVVLKPHEPGLRTNLVLVTNRRVYHLELVSPPEEALEAAAETGEPVAYHHHVAFWYPEAWAQRLRATAEAARAGDEQERPARVLPGALPAELSFAYRLVRPKKRARRLLWEPVTVFDDGERTYIVLPPAARAQPLPAVLAAEGGRRRALDAQLHGDWLVVPQLVERAELVYGSGASRRSLTLVRGE